MKFISKNFIAAFLIGIVCISVSSHLSRGVTSTAQEENINNVVQLDLSDSTVTDFIFLKKYS